MKAAPQDRVTIFCGAFCSNKGQADIRNPLRYLLDLVKK